MFENSDTEIRTLSLNEIDFVSGGAESDKAREDRTKDYQTGEKPVPKTPITQRVQEEDEKIQKTFYVFRGTIEADANTKLPGLPTGAKLSGKIDVCITNQENVCK